MRKSSFIFIFALLINLAFSTVPDCRDIEPWAMSTCYADGTYVFTDDGQIFQAHAINGKKAVDNCCQDPHTQTNYWQNTGSTCGCPCAGIPAYDESFTGYYNAGTRRVFNGIIWKASTKTSSYPLDANSQWVVDGVCFKSCNAAPSWSNSKVYYENNVVIRNNRLYIATWQTQGVAPSPSAQYNGWRHLGSCYQITIETDGCDVDLSCPFERETDGLFRLLQSEEFDVTFNPNGVDSQGRQSRIKRILVNNVQVNGAYGPGESVTKHYQGLTANTVIRAECETQTILSITSDQYTQDGARTDGNYFFWPSENTAVSSCAVATPSGNDRQTRVTEVLVDGESTAFCYNVLMNEDHSVNISGEIQAKLTISSDQYTQDGEQADGTYYYWPSDGEVYNSCAEPTLNVNEVERLRRVTQVLVDGISDADFCYSFVLDSDHSIVISGEEQYKLNISTNQYAEESIEGDGCHFFWPGETAQICPQATDGERARRINSFTIDGEETPVACPYSIVMNSDHNVNILAEEQFCLTISGTGTTESSDGEYADGTYCLWPGTEVDLCIAEIDVPNREERIKEVLVDEVAVDLNNICPLTITMNEDHTVSTCTETQVKLAIMTDQYTQANLADGCIFKYPSEQYQVEVCASATPNAAEPQRQRRITSFTVNNVPKVGCASILLTQDTTVVITGEEQVRLSIQGDCLSNNQALTQNYYYWPNTNTVQYQITAPQQAGQTCTVVSVSGASNPVQFTPLTADQTVITDCNCVLSNPIFPVPAGSNDNILFIIDNSGSMSDNSEQLTYQSQTKTRWAWVKQYLINYIDTLNSSNRVNIITFDSSTPKDQWKSGNPSSMQSSWAMDNSGRNNVKSFINGLSQSGNTDLQEAINYGINRNYITDVDKIYFLSDGVPTQGFYQSLTSFTNWLTTTFNTPSVSAKINNKFIVVNIGPTTATRQYMKAIVWLNVTPQTDPNRQHGAVYYEFP